MSATCQLRHPREQHLFPKHPLDHALPPKLSSFRTRISHHKERIHISRYTTRSSDLRSLGMVIHFVRLEPFGVASESGDFQLNHTLLVDIPISPVETLFIHDIHFWAMWRAITVFCVRLFLCSIEASHRIRKQSTCGSTPIPFATHEQKSTAHLYLFPFKQS